MSYQLTVRVNDEFALDAGTYEEISAPESHELLIHPPAETLFDQLLDYLRAKPDPPTPLSGSMTGREGVAATAVTLRWGSYFAVLADRYKPVWTEVGTQNTSRIADAEMARINIEASAALAKWIDIYRTDPHGEYPQLVNRAVFYFPMPRKTSSRERGPLMALAIPECATELVTHARASSPEHFERVRANCNQYPSRVFANTLVNVAWRNGPIEDIHAGQFRSYPLHQRRIAIAEERTLMNLASRHFADGMFASAFFNYESPQRSWPEQVLPYGLTPFFAPSQWTLTEHSRDVRLPFLR
jgi:hypothetical protein